MGDKGAVSFLKSISSIGLSLLAFSAVMAGEVNSPTPVKSPALLTEEEVDRAKDLCILRLQQRIVSVISQPSSEALDGLYNGIHHVKDSDYSPFAPGFRYHLAEPTPNGVSKPLRTVSSLEKQTQQENDVCFAKAKDYVAEALAAYETRRKRAVTFNLQKASKELGKIKAELLTLRKHRDAALNAKVEAKAEAPMSAQQKSTIPGYE